MAAFPTLTRKASPEFDETYEDSVIRSNFEGGYELTRQKYTRLRKVFTGVTYRGLTDADKTLMNTFVGTTVKGGADSFTWTHPGTLASHTVRFVKPPQYKAVISGVWEMTFDLREV